MDIDKEELAKQLEKGNLDYVFVQAYQIASFVIYAKFNIADEEYANDLLQDCMADLLKKVIRKKIDTSKNVFAFIWANSRLTILDNMRRKRNRAKIVKFVSIESLQELEDEHRR